MQPVKQEHLSKSETCRAQVYWFPYLDVMVYKWSWLNFGSSWFC